MMEYVLSVLIVAAFYAMLAQSLNFFSGNTGLLSLMHAGFLGLGAYVWAITTVNGVPLALASVAAVTMVAAVSGGVAFVAFRTRDDYFVIITLSIQMLTFDALNNFSSITNGPVGIAGIRQMQLFSSLPQMAALALVLSLLLYFLLWRLERSVWVRNLRAIRDDDVLMMTLGKPVMKLKAITFIFSAVVAGGVGVLLAQYVTFIDPTSFSVSESILILSIVIVGGLGNLHGAYFAALFLVGLPEAVRFIGMPNLAEGNVRQIVYGIALVLAMLLRSRQTVAT